MVLVSRAQKRNVLGNRNTVRQIHTHVHRQSNQTGWCVRTEYKASDNGEQLRMCSVTGVCNEGKMSPGGREMVNSDVVYPWYKDIIYPNMHMLYFIC